MADPYYPAIIGHGRGLPVSNVVDISTPAKRREAEIDMLERRRAYWSSHLARRPRWGFLLDKVAEIDRRLVPLKLAKVLGSGHGKA